MRTYLKGILQIAEADLLAEHTSFNSIGDSTRELIIALT